jgi:threonine/homoserine/homoserine lactone efflux protein
MFWTLLAVLVALWFVGFMVYLIAGSVIHLWLRMRSPWRSNWGRRAP